ncbi:MAG: glycosyltransferase family 4 protein [Armatimonadetes bacterium]|nr:glycosyltransferase family 4 protein [Armatimonadota bacterium]
MSLAPLRVLHLITPKRFSGAERVCAQLCEQLQGRGHDVLVVTKSLAGFEADLDRHGVPFRTARIGNKFDFSRIFAIMGHIRRYRADLLHTHLSTATQWGTIAAHFAGIPCVAHVHAMNRAIWYIWATRVIAVADAVRRHLLEQGLRPDRVDVIHNAVEVDGLPEVDGAAVRHSLNVPPGTPLIAVAAHLSRRKGLHVLLQAMPHVRRRAPNAQCLLMGEGSCRGPLEAQASALGLGDAVKFLGFRDDARELMSAADVVCLPSIAGEGLPMALLEAMARRRPVVATRLAGVPEAVVDGETGFLVQPGDAEQLADRLATLLTQPDLRRRLGEAARALAVRCFSPGVRCERVEAVYRDALAQKRR